jgi:hypothetical protein
LSIARPFDRHIDDRTGKSSEETFMEFTITTRVCIVSIPARDQDGAFCFDALTDGHE